MKHELHGLYVITDEALCASRGIETCVQAALDGGARIVQYRDKSDDHARRLRETTALRKLCESRRAVFIVNDDVALARASGAHGVHIGREDSDIHSARDLLGPEAIIGVSCYDDFARARRAANAGASYVAFGSVFPSAIKPDARRAPLELFDRARRELAVPACAIGGIDAWNIAQLARAGAAMVAVISAVFAADDIERQSRLLSERFEANAAPS